MSAMHNLIKYIVTWICGQLKIITLCLGISLAGHLGNRTIKVSHIISIVHVRICLCNNYSLKFEVPITAWLL